MDVLDSVKAGDYNIAARPGVSKPAVSVWERLFWGHRDKNPSPPSACRKLRLEAR